MAGSKYEATLRRKRSPFLIFHESIVIHPFRAEYVPAPYFYLHTIMYYFGPFMLLVYLLRYMVILSDSQRSAIFTPEAYKAMHEIS